MSRLLRLWVPVALALSAAGSMALEIVAGRLLAPYVGMSLYTWTAIIAVVLTGLSVGHWIGGVLADRVSAHARTVGLSLLAAAVTAFASLWALRWAAGGLIGGLDPLSAIGVLALAAFLAPSLFAGIVSPVLTRMALDAAPPDRRGRVLGAMFALGAVGAILGTVVAGFVLVAWIGSHGSVALIAAAYALLAVPFLARAGAAVAAAAALGALVLGAVGPGRLGALASPCAVESVYYCIQVDEVTVDGRPARVLALDHLGHGVNDRAEPRHIPSPYVQLVDEIMRRRLEGGAPEAFFVGGGAYTLPRAWAARHPDARLAVAEIDPAVTRVADERLWADTDRMEVVHGDARLALSRMPGYRRFDVIFGDAFHDVSIPQHLVTDEFHAELARRLRPGGFYAINVVEALREPPFLLSLVDTLEARFEVVELWLDTESVARAGTEGRATWVVIASDEDTGVREIRSTAGPLRTWLRVPTERMQAVMPKDARVFLTDDHAPVARLMRHILLDARLAD